MRVAGVERREDAVTIVLAPSVWERVCGLFVTGGGLGMLVGGLDLLGTQFPVGSGPMDLMRTIAIDFVIALTLAGICGVWLLWGVQHLTWCGIHIVQALGSRQVRIDEVWWFLRTWRRVSKLPPLEAVHLTEVFGEGSSYAVCLIAGNESRQIDADSYRNDMLVVATSLADSLDVPFIDKS